MDLQGFNNDSLVKIKATSFTAGEALNALDGNWYTRVSRRARWMDLIGDYAGNEPFVIDGISFFFL
jgi:hypothetical protein